MIKVTITDSSGREREIEVDSEHQMLGRGEDSDIVLGSRSVSRHHLRLWEDGGKLMVEDMTGGTGITLDGEEVSGIFELEPGADMEAGVFVFNIPGTRRSTSIDGEALGDEIPIPTLVGTKSVTKGLEIELQEGDNDVGRDPALYLVIDDHSVSRQHARLTVEAGLFTLVDMRSSNGTFVNNKRIEEHQLRSGDLVRFGSLEFKFLYGKAVSVDAAKLRRKKILIILGGVIGLVIIIAVGVKLFSSKPPPRTGPANGPSGPPIEVQVEQLVRSAKAFMQEGNWKASIKELDKALDIHPICAECHKLKQVVEEEIANKGFFDQCVVDYELNSWQKAMDCFKRLPAGSYYEKKSKYKVSDCVKRLKAYHMGEGKGYISANRYCEARKHFAAYMELAPCDKNTYNKHMKKAEKGLTKRRFPIRKCFGEVWKKVEWTCKTERSSKGGTDPEDALRTMYRDPKIFKPVNLYFKGKVDPAIHELQKIVGLERDQGRVEAARDLIRDLRVVKGKYADGMSQLMRGKISEAREAFDQAMLIDKKIMPKGVISFYREDIGKSLSSKLHKEALGLFNRNHYLKAFEIWTECLQRNPGAGDCQLGMNLLDGVGENALVEAGRQEGQRNLERVVQILKHIMEITPAEKMSHKKAQIWLNKIEVK